MPAYAASIVRPQPLGNWSLLFARQPEPDLDFEEDLAEDTQPMGGQSPAPGKPPKKKGTSPILWVLLLALLGVGGYYAMDPDGFMGMVNSTIGGPAEPTASMPPPRPAPTPPMAAKPAAVAVPAPEQAAPMDEEAHPGMPAPGPSSAAPATAAPAPAMPSAPPAPMFAEGQRVTPSGQAPITLSKSSAGSTPVSSATPGTQLIVMDGELQGSGWIYQVRTVTGAVGWAPERQLRQMP